MRYKLCLMNVSEGKIKESLFSGHQNFLRYGISLKLCEFIGDIKSYILSYSTVK